MPKKTCRKESALLHKGKEYPITRESPYCPECMGILNDGSIKKIIQGKSDSIGCPNCRSNFKVI